MTTVNVYEAKTHFSQLLARVEAGEEIVVCRAGKPVARLSKVAPGSKPRRVFGQDRGKFVVPDDFNDPLPEDMQRALEGYDD